MTGIFAKQPVAGRPRCARCKRPFTPHKDGDLYGPTWARKMAGQVELDHQVLVSGVVLHKGKEKSVPIYVKGETGEITAVII